MTDSDYDVWCRRYCALFRADLGRLAQTLEEWRGVFEAGKYSAGDLDDALSTLAAAPPPSDWQHLRRLTEILRERRTVTLRARLTEAQRREEAMGVCGLCGSTGYVAVPHPRCLNVEGEYVPLRVARGGSGTYYDLAVYCRCPLGIWLDTHHAEYWSRKRAQSGKHESGAWTLDRYEQVNPRWASQMRERAAFEAELLRAEEKQRGRSSTSPASGVAPVAQQIDALMDRLCNGGSEQ